MKHPHRRSRPVVQASKRRRQQRLLYRNGLTPDELERIVLEIGPERVLNVAAWLTRPELPLEAAE